MVKKMITIKSEREIELMRHAGMLVSKMHKFIKPYIKEGISTYELDKLCEDFIRKNDAIPTCKGYEGFPATLCTSVNSVVVHGIPNKKTILKNGDIITIDVVIGYKGYQGDAAWTDAVGEINNEKKYLMEHTEKALYEGVKKVKPGNRIGDISAAIQKYAEDHQCFCMPRRSCKCDCSCFDRRFRQSAGYGRRAYVRGGRHQQRRTVRARDDTSDRTR